MIGKLLCKLGFHKWESLWRPSKCSFYPFDILVSKTCTRCKKTIVPTEKGHSPDDAVL
jgi:hypothetical protein